MALTPEDQAIIDKLNETGWTADPSEPPPLTDEDAQPDQPALALIQGGAGKAEKPKLVVQTPLELRADLGEVRPIRAAYLVDGAITILDGTMKESGKTTFALALSKSVIEGSEFLGVQSKKSPVVYLNESPAVSFIQALDNAGLSETNDLHIVNFHQNFDLEWPEKVKQAVELAKKVGAGLLVVDTFAQWAGLTGDDENSAGATMAAIKPVQEHAQTARLAILFIRHTRKSGGGVGVSGRGSTAVTGAVDDIVLIWKPTNCQNPNQRHLDYLGRNGHPLNQVIEMTDDGYQLMGTPKQVKAEGFQAELIRVILDDPLNKDELSALLRSKGIKFRANLLFPTLCTMLSQKLLVRTGKGVKGDPYLYSKHSVLDPGNCTSQNPRQMALNAFPAPPPLREERESLETEKERQGTESKPTREPGEDDDE